MANPDGISDKKKTHNQESFYNRMISLKQFFIFIVALSFLAFSLYFFYSLNRSATKLTSGTSTSEYQNTITTLKLKNEALEEQVTHLQFIYNSINEEMKQLQKANLQKSNHQNDKSKKSVTSSEDDNSPAGDRIPSSDQSEGHTLVENKPHFRFVVAIPTISRRGKTSYLDKVLERWFQQMGPLSGDISSSSNHPSHERDQANTKINGHSWTGMQPDVHLIVMNMKRSDITERNEVFYTMKKKYERFEKLNYIRFVENLKDHNINEVDPIPPNERHLFRRDANLSPNVKKQTKHLIDLMRYTMSHIRGDYYLFTEDDMMFCQNGLLAIQHLVQKATLYSPDWIVIRCGFGMNGIIFKLNQDLQTFANYLEKHYQRRPPDHLITEWSAAETKESANYVQKRPIIAYRYNLFEHIGSVSSLRSAAPWEFPKCYHEFLYPTAFEVESFHHDQCPTDDIWPCNVSEEKKSIFKWIKFNA